MTRNQILLVIIVSVLGVMLVTLPWSSGPIGKGDFIGYWSASRLLLQGHNPYDLVALRDLQFQAYPERGYLIYTWNPPWLLVLLLPLAVLPFQMAVQVWLLSNLVIIGAASLWLWRMVDSRTNARSYLVAALAGVLFPPSLAAIGTGQIVPAVWLATIAVAESLWCQRRSGWAGVWFAVMLLKPQVTFLAAALSVWHSLKSRQWRFIVTSAGTLVFLLIVATALYPSWLEHYLQNVTAQGVTQWQTPTLGGLLLWLWPISWLRYVGLLGVALVPVFARRLNGSTMYAALRLTLALGVALAPFGWSFDQILLLPMVLQLMRWQQALKTWWLAFGLAVVYAVPLGLRVIEVDEFLYSWVPWFVLGLYGVTVIMVKRTKREALVLRGDG